MMSKTFTGVIFGLIIAFVSAWLFMQIAQFIAGGITSFWGESWLFYAVIIPCTLTFAFLGGYFYKKEEVTNKKLWLISLLSAFFITLFSGTIGAILGESIVRGGMETINIEGTLVWGTIYAFVFLPFTTAFARLIIGGFYSFIKTKK
ncbi:hypothetical protein SAMN05880501_108127 [Ureibacillus xyleni]|uniref:Uncharacterized protein n=2 Tax=Ureibacillus xyleni TaxID=614648 RepID=A0A285T2X4_9BACL|nr:hypothetical protein SAMN05880501_108127 [Ureibacillus xyleni]